MKKVIIIFIISIFIFAFAIFINNFYTKDENINIEKGKTNDTVEENNP